MKVLLPLILLIYDERCERVIPPLPILSREIKKKKKEKRMKPDIKLNFPKVHETPCGPVRFS